MKKVSVIIPAYNKAVLTVKTVESVLAQTYENIEIIVVDDGSTDNTEELLLPYAEKIKYIRKQNSGASSARNLGINNARGEYIGFIDCDDMYSSKKIEKSVEFLEKNSDIGFVHTPVYFIDDKDNILRTYYLKEAKRSGWISGQLLLRNFICNSTVVAKKTCFEKCGLFDENIFIPADWDMWLRLSEKYKAGYINEPLTLYRKSSGYVFKNLEQTKKEGLIVLDKAFKRNPDLDKDLKNRAVSNIHFYHAIGHLKVNDLEEARQELKTAVKKDQMNFRALGVLSLISLLGKKMSWVMDKLGFSE
ncbi:MAG: glycosyltransferase [Candidatus Omnitrophota bacterium]